MAARLNRSLYLSVDGNVDRLGTAMKAGKTVLLSLGSAALDVQAEVEKAFADLGANAPAQAKVLERSYTNTFNAIRENAKAVLGANDNGAALKVLDAGAAEGAARAAENQAAALRQVATAAAAVAQRAGEAGEAERVLAIAAAANAQQAETEAVALRNQANVLGAVRGELTSMGVVQTKAVAINGQAKAGYQQLSYQLGDIATQYSLGASASVIFASQSSQVIQAIQLISGESKGLIGILGGPWGLALTSAVTLAAPFVGKLLEGSDALGKQTDQLEENAEKTAVAEQAKQAFIRTEAGAIDDVRALTEELKKQNAELKTNAERLNIRSKRNLETLTSQRGGVATALGNAQADVSRLRAGGQDDSGALLTAAQLQVAELTSRLGAIDVAIADARATVQRSRAELADEAAKRANDPLEQIRRKYEGSDGLIEQAKKRAIAEGTVDATLTKQLATLRAQQKAETEAAQKKIAASKQTGSNNNQIGREVTVAEATRIASSIGGVVTSGLRSTEKQAQLYADKLAGRHAGPVAKPGTSDHERGQAIDIAYGPGVSVSSIRKAFAKEGVAIRQLLDEKEQRVFHVAFGPKGKSQDTIDRQTESAEQKRIRDEEAYAQLRSRAEQQLLDAKRAQVVSITEAAQLDENALRLEQARLDSAAQAGVAEKRWTQAKADELKALNKSTADLKAAGIADRARMELASEAVRVQRDDLQAENALLSLQADMTTSARDRRRIGLQILANEEKIARATLQAAIDAEKDPSEKGRLQRRLADVGPTFAGERQRVEEQTEGPLDAYRRQLRESVGDTNDALQGIAVRGFGAIEDASASAIGGAVANLLKLKGVAGSVVSQIFSDLARLAARKAFVALLGGGFAKGGLIQANAAGGLISGAGTGTSDDILSWLSNGEFVVTAAATRRHLPLLKAINDNQLPGFASGGLVGSMALPRLPDVRKAANDVYAGRRQRLEVATSVAVEPSPLFYASARQTAVQVVGAAAEPIMAGAEGRTMRRLSRPSLPGAPG